MRQHPPGSAANMDGFPMATYGTPHFCNDIGVEKIHIGVKEFQCMGTRPPGDHPHIFLDMGSDDQIVGNPVVKSGDDNEVSAFGDRGYDTVRGPTNLDVARHHAGKQQRVYF